MTKYNSKGIHNRTFPCGSTEGNLNSCKALVLYGTNLSSTVGSPRYTAFDRNLIKIPSILRPLFIGIIISDAYIQQQYKGDARLQFKQTYRHFEYFYSVFFRLSHYCSKGPYVTKTTLHKKVHYGLGFTTRSLACITELYHLWYNGKQKIIPNNIYDLLTWESLAHWTYQKSNIKYLYFSGTNRDKVYGLYIIVDAYKIKDIVLLMNVLMVRHRLSCTLQYKKNKPYIYIKNKSIPSLLRGVSPFINSINNGWSIRRMHSGTNPSSPQVVPVLVYGNADTSKKEIVSENKGKAGIYRWVNLESGKSYVGSSINLGIRLKNYFSYNYLTDPKRNTPIHKALLKYGYSGFKLEILEFCSNKNEVIAREQHYLDLLKPEYNILEKAGSSLGFVHSKETIAKFKEIAKKRVYSEERKANFGALAHNRSEELKERYREHLLKLNLSKGHSVEVINVSTNEKAIYPTIRQAASALETSHPTILRYLKSQKLFKGIYKISYVGK